MEDIERIALGILLDIGTKSNFFVLFLQLFHYYYRKVLPMNHFEIVAGCFSFAFLRKDYDPRFPAFFAFFQLAGTLEHLGETESRLIAGIYSSMLLHHRLIPSVLSFPFMCFNTLISLSALKLRGFKNYQVIYLALVIQVFGFIKATALHDYLQENSGFIVYWAVVSVIGLIAIIVANKNSVSLMIQRKLFHFLLLLVFVPALENKLILTIAFLAALYAAILIEGLRKENKTLQEFFQKFIDEKDSQDLVVTHIYLLFGIGFPVYFSVIFENEFLALAGVLSLGLGDTFACLVGHYFGKIRLPYRKKTFEGTFACFLAMVLGLRMFCELTAEKVTVLFLVSLYEAYTVKIDNLVLPTLAFGLFSQLSD